MVSDKVLRTAEIVCCCIGVALVGVYFAVRAQGEVERRAAITAFMAEAAHTQALPSSDKTMAAPGSLTYAKPDKAHWSKGRIRAYEAAQATVGKSDRFPVAVLRIRRIGLEVPVYAADTARNMNRGAVLVQGTAPPDTGGNTAIAAHRDGYFRLLENVVPGDVLTVESLHRMQRYRVTLLEVVKPTDVSVLHQTNVPVVTLVTCYPFYFVGPAPQRYIVRAVAFEPSGMENGQPVSDSPARVTPKHGKLTGSERVARKFMLELRDWPVRFRSGNMRRGAIAFPAGVDAHALQFFSRSRMRNSQPAPDRHINR